MIQVFKILNNIDQIDKKSMFKVSTYEATRGHSQKIFKKRYRLKTRGHFFSAGPRSAIGRAPDS